MPKSIHGAVSVGALPISLSKKFTESLGISARVNEYHDGSTQRQAVNIASRRTWRLAKRLTPAQMTLLRDFWEANRANAFTFYNPFQTNPPFSDSPSGTAGLYYVRFASDWEQSTYMARGNAQIELVELAGRFLSSITVDTRLAYLQLGGVSNGFGGISYSIDGGASWVGGTGQDLSGFGAVHIDPTGQIVTSLAVPGPVSQDLLSLRFFCAGSLFAESVHDEFRIYEMSTTLFYTDGSSDIYKPHSVDIIPMPGTPSGGIFGAGNSGITNANNAIDGNDSTYAVIYRDHFSALSFSAVLELSDWRVTHG